MYYSCHTRQDETWPFSVLLSFELTSIPHHALAAYQVKFRVICFSGGGWSCHLSFFFSEFRLVLGQYKKVLISSGQSFLTRIRHIW
jgi:hypothetical protein